MTTHPDAVDPDVLGSRPHGSILSPLRSEPGALLIVVVVVVAARLLVASGGRVFRISYDEPTQLAVARTVGGGSRWLVTGDGTWQPAFGLLTAPLHVLFDDPENAFRATLFINGLIGGLGAVLLYIGLRRTAIGTSVSSSTLAAVAILCASAPAAVRSSSYAWSDPMLTTVFLATWCATLSVVRDRSIGAARWLIVISAIAYLVHHRALPFVLVAMVFAGWSFRSRTRDVLGLVGLAAALMTAMWVVSTVVFRLVWVDADHLKQPGELSSRVAQPGQAFDAGVGQLWYQLTSSAGLVGIGLGLLVASLSRRSAASWVCTRADAAITLLLIVPTIVMSSFYMAGRVERADFLVYGRYIDDVSWPLWAIGILGVLRFAGHRRQVGLSSAASIAMMLVSGAYLLVGHEARLARGPVLPDMVSGLTPLVGLHLDRIVMAVVLACGILVVLMTTALSGPRSLPLTLSLCGALMVAGSFRNRETFAPAENLGRSAVAVREVLALVPPSDRIAYVLPQEHAGAIVDDSVSILIELQYFQFYLPERELETSAPLRPGQFVFAHRDDSDIARMATKVWSNERRFTALWLME